MLSSHSLLVALALSTFACAEEGAPDAEAGETGEQDLVGGRLARRGEHDATMQIEGNCTVSKIGPRLILTAAHCVGGYVAGTTIRVGNAKAFGRFARTSADLYAEYTLERVEIEPAWLATCAARECGSVHVSGTTEMADAAVLVTTADIAGVPEAAIDLAPVADGDLVVLTGYGCEDQVAGTWDYSGSRLRVSQTSAIPFTDTLHPGSFVNEQDRQNGTVDIMKGIYVITPGPEWVRTAGNTPPEAGNGRRGGLCPGDSGGPLYRAGSGPSVVVGINANYTFASGTEYQVDGRTFEYGGRPRTNWQTRVDGSSGLRVGQWLRTLGANAVCTRGTCE